MRIKNLCVGFICSLVLVACQGNSIEVDEENNREVGVSAADFFEYELYEYLCWGGHVPQSEFYGLPIITDIIEEKAESDSKILLLHWKGLPIREDAEEMVLNDIIDLAKVIKTNLVDSGYGQDVYIKVYNEKDELVGIVNNDSEYFDVK